MSAIVLPKYKSPTRVASSAQVGSGAQVLVAALLVGGAAAAGTLEIKNAATDTGDAVVEVKAGIGGTAFVDLSLIGGVAFDTAMYAKIAGTGAVAYIWVA